MRGAFLGCDTLYHSFKPFNKHFTKMCIFFFFAQKGKNNNNNKKEKKKRSLLFGSNLNSAAVCKTFCSAAFANHLVQSKRKPKAFLTMDLALTATKHDGGHSSLKSTVICGSITKSSIKKARNRNKQTPGI